MESLTHFFREEKREGSTVSELLREKGEGLTNIQNIGRWNYSALELDGFLCLNPSPFSLRITALLNHCNLTLSQTLINIWNHPFDLPIPSFIFLTYTKDQGTKPLFKDNLKLSWSEICKKSRIHYLKGDTDHIIFGLKKESHNEDRAERYDFCFHSPFLRPTFLRREEKKGKNN